MHRTMIALAVAALMISQSADASPKPATKKTAGKPSSSSTGNLLNPSKLTAKAPEVFQARFDTSKGPFVIEVHRAWAPNGADRFYNLVKNGYFDDARFFRVISGFMVQFGINGKPAVNKAWQSASIHDDPVKQSNTRGMVTFAMRGPDTRTTQVFINFADNARLDSTGFAPFGKVTEGLSVVDALNAEYGEGAPRGAGPAQDRLQDEGNTYLSKDFPRLDYIKTARIVAAK